MLTSRFRGALPVALTLLAALVVGGYWLLAFPPWQHNDEPTHFEYAWLLAHRGHAETFGPESRDLPMQRDLRASMVAHDFYRGGSAPPLFAGTARAPFWFGYDETVHPPTYYRLVALPLKALAYLDITSQLYVARAVSLLLFVTIIAVAIAAMRELTAAGSPLRWAVPLTMILWPPFASHMTAVNNDVGAVLAVTLFLWATARTVRVGPSLLNVALLVGAGLLGLAFKTTASVTLLLLPLVLLVALWRRRGWRWRFLVAPLALLAVALAALLFDASGAAHWRRSETTTFQRAPLRVPSQRSGQALQIERDASLYNELLTRYLPELRGKSVTVGGWLWADGALEGGRMGLQLSARGNRHNDYLVEALPPATTTPTLHHYRFTVPEETGRIAFLFSGQQGGASGGSYYLDDAFVVAGELPEGATLQVEGQTVLVNDSPRPNLLRNPAIEQRGWQLRPAVDVLVYRYARRSPTTVLGSLLDTEESLPLLTHQISPILAKQLFGSFAWGHVNVGAAWYPLGWLLVAGALVGGVRWLARRPAGGARPATLLLWGLLLLVGIANALLWPLAYAGALRPPPSARYIHPMLLVMALLLAGGWHALSPRRWRGAGLTLLFTLLLLLNLVSARTIQQYYHAPTDPSTTDAR